MKTNREAGNCWTSLLEGEYCANAWVQNQMQKKLTLERFQREVRLTALRVWSMFERFLKQMECLPGSGVQIRELFLYRNCVYRGFYPSFNDSKKIDQILIVCSVTLTFCNIVEDYTSAPLFIWISISARILDLTSAVPRFLGIMPEAVRISPTWSD